MQRSWVLAVCLAITHGAGRAQTLKPVLPGMEQLEAKCASAADGSVALDGVRVDPSRLTVRLLDSYTILGGTRSFTGFTLRDLASRVRALAIINGGATASLSLPVPVGLLVTDGRLVSKPSLQSKTLSGFLCFTAKTVTVLPISSYQPGGCQSALQAGPIAIDGGRNAILKSELKLPAYRRSLAAVDGSGRLILIATSKVHLYELAECLVGGLKRLDIRKAINLDGDLSSGLLLAGAQGATRREAGNTSSLVASAIAVLSSTSAAKPSRLGIQAEK